MIQRIQTVFLALASLCTFGSFGLDLADTETPVPLETSPYFGDATFDVVEFIPTLIAVAIAGAVYLFAIFLFRNRPVQLKLSQTGNFFGGIAIGTILYQIFLLVSDGFGVMPDFGSILLLSAIIFGAFAAKYIKKDEKLVRSADRLR